MVPFTEVSFDRHERCGLVESYLTLNANANPVLYCSVTAVTVQSVKLECTVVTTLTVQCSVSNFM